MHKVIVMPAAERDLEGLTAFVRRDSPVQADRIEDRRFAAMASLAEFPLRCGVAVESARWGYSVRCLPVHRYRVLYTVRDSTVFVLRIVHGSMNSPVEPDA
ncbi:hypothetical protein PHYC_03229 [Phycisphaerales bacterium]|nr:hypothetical protein PHYC_03229 [Phycisphaerales bacterium]